MSLIYILLDKVKVLMHMVQAVVPVCLYRIVSSFVWFVTWSVRRILHTKNGRKYIGVFFGSC